MSARVRGGIALILLASAGLLVVVVLRRPRATAPVAAPPSETLTSLKPGRSVGRTESTRKEFIGVVLPRESVEVASPLDGKLTAVFVNLGDHVRANARVAALDSAELRRELEMAEASLRAARAEELRAESLHDEARKRQSRVSSLGNLVAETDRAAAELEAKLAASTVEASRAQVDKEKAGVERLRETLASADIKAPFDGTIAYRYQDPGTMLHKGSPIVRLIRSDDLWVRFAVPEGDLAGLTRGARVGVDVEGLGTSVPGVVEQIAPELDAASRMIVVEAKLAIPAGLKDSIQAGLTCRVRVAAGTSLETGGT